MFYLIFFWETTFVCSSLGEQSMNSNSIIRASVVRLRKFH